jgi:hypothetical protein
MNKAAANQERGQACVEVLLGAIVLLTLWLAIAWIGRLQHRGLSADQASRQAAFSAAQGQPERHSALAERTLQYARLASQPGFLAIGGGGANATTLRRDWHIDDEGLLRVSASIVIDTHKSCMPRPTDGNGRMQFDPAIWRHTLLVTGDGHAAGDLPTQTLLERSYVGWQQAYNKSRAAANHVKSRLTPLDEPWNRPSLQTNWLAAWSDLIPENHLQSSQGIK